MSKKKFNHKRALAFTLYVLTIIVTAVGAVHGLSLLDRTTGSIIFGLSCLAGLYIVGGTD